MSLPLPLVSVKGSYEQMGYQYGTQCTDLITSNVTDYLRRFAAVVDLSEQAVREWGKAFQEIVRGYNRDIADMLTGVARGSGLAPELIFALNGRTELLYGQGSREDACTSLAVLPSRTVDGHTLVGQNWDWHPEQKPLSLLLRTEDEDGFVVLTLAEAGMIAKAGVNSAGIGLCGNLLVSTDDKTGPGVPYHCILRGILQSHSMADAIRAAADTTRVSSGNVLLADGAGEILDLELKPGDFGHLYAEDGLIAHANHFDSSVTVSDVRKAKSALTLLRPQRVRHLLEEPLASRKVDRTTLADVFRDHFSYPNGICRHADPRDHPDTQVASLFSIIIDATDKCIYIAESPICDNEFQCISLDD